MPLHYYRPTGGTEYGKESQMSLVSGEDEEDVRHVYPNQGEKGWFQDECVLLQTR